MIYQVGQCEIKQSQVYKYRKSLIYIAPLFCCLLSFAFFLAIATDSILTSTDDYFRTATNSACRDVVVMAKLTDVAKCNGTIFIKSFFDFFQEFQLFLWISLDLESLF